MIRSFKRMRPVIPSTCYVDESAQIIGDAVLGEHASVWMNTVLRGDVYATPMVMLAAVVPVRACPRVADWRAPARLDPFRRECLA